MAPQSSPPQQQRRRRGDRRRPCRARSRSGNRVEWRLLRMAGLLRFAVRLLLAASGLLHAGAAARVLRLWLLSDLRWKAAAVPFQPSGNICDGNTSMRMNLSNFAPVAMAALLSMPAAALAQ